MHCLARNKQALYYALYQEKTEILDSYGNKTGTYKEGYSAPEKVYMNISPAKGTVDLEQFGLETNYSKTIVTDNLDCPIKEDSILWVGILPDENGEDGAVKHNYAVVSIARSLNSITYAIKEVNVT